MVEAIRAREDIRARLTDLYRQRDQLEPPGSSGAAAAANKSGQAGSAVAGGANQAVFARLRAETR